MDYQFTCLGCGTHEEPQGVDMPPFPETLYWVCRYCGLAWPCANASQEMHELAVAMVDSHNNHRTNI